MVRWWDAGLRRHGGDERDGGEMRERLRNEQGGEEVGDWVRW